MSAPISIVIPTLNAERDLPATLQSLMEGLQQGLIRELIVSDAGSDDATLEMADEAGARIVTGPASRGGQLQRGCAEASGEWLLILHADTELQPSWTAVVAEHLNSDRPASFRLRFRANGLGPLWVAGWANLRSRLFGLPYGDQGLLVRQEAYLSAGGYPDQPLMEDVALIRALPRAVLLNADAVTSAERYIRQGWFRRGARNLWTLMRYFLGADPKKLAQAYRG
ncbi:TIGR04283 family arsenosugar biosynthesis glycosyltransferase [uncultured Ruegeria sp.]|uniref:TIGR04283 family arsenosugar biosynthesis glycosyltransferase n=1 Tax=uncultured Ruegeria sp. TaxID=259304 RepID=UPI00260911F1|nr:TIGR04283 family arsenosugar biosynthesis glycosyltransferase [uncultured Ruegeria sp.]